jgi:ferredoxin
MLSADAVALDSTACEMINLAPELVPTITWGQRWGLGQYQNIQFVGDAIESFRSPDFVVNRARGSTTGRPGLMSRFMREWVVPRPALISERCVRCGLCARMCPVEPKAIDFRDPGGPDCPPAYDYHLCIRCYCCQELCPEKAIVVQERPLGRLFGRHPG